MTPDGYEVLLVEDGAPDVRLMREAVREAGAPFTLVHARDGVEALALLRARAKEGPARQPDLILLDLNMPRMNGREFLQALKADPHLSGLNVVVLSSTRSADDIDASLALGARAHMPKPNDLDSLTGFVKSIRERWPSD